jgi:DNA-binding MarR family transcriptional regulator
VYKVGERTVIKGDKLVREAVLKFVWKYAGLTVECSDDCSGAIDALAKASNYNIPKSAIIEKIEELKEKYGTVEVTPIIDYVKQYYPDEFEKITKDPFNWVLEKTAFFPGHEKEKLAVFLAVVSSRLHEVLGLARVHLMLLGDLSEHIVYSILRLLEGTDILYATPKFTRNTVLEIAGMDANGKVFYVGGVSQSGIHDLGVLMTDNGLTVLRAMVTGEGLKTVQLRVDGEPVVITTKMPEKPDSEWWLLSKFLIVYARGEPTDTKAIITLNTVTGGVDVKDRLVFLAYLYSRPEWAELPHDIADIMGDFIRSIADLSHAPVTRTTEILVNLTRAVAIAKGKEEISREDLDFVLKYFGKEIAYNALELLEPEARAIEVMPYDDSVTVDDIANALKVTVSEAKKVLRRLEDYGYITQKPEEQMVMHEYVLTERGKAVKEFLTKMG